MQDKTNVKNNIGINGINTNINVDEKGNLNITRILEFDDVFAAKKFFESNYFTKLSFEAIAIMGNFEKSTTAVFYELVGKYIGGVNKIYAKNYLKYKINTDRGLIFDLMLKLKLSESSIRRAIQDLKNYNFLIPVRDINGIVVKGAYVFNINFINDLNFEQWYKAVHDLNTNYHVQIQYKFKYKEPPCFDINK